MTELHPEPFDWDRLWEIAEVRHAFAHANGRFADVQERRRRYLRQRLETTEGVVDEDGYLVASTRYALDTAVMIEDCLSELVNRLAPVIVEENMTRSGTPPVCLHRKGATRIPLATMWFPWSGRVETS